MAALKAMSASVPYRLGIYAVVLGTMEIQSRMGHTDTHKVHPVQSSVTVGMCVCGSKRMAWYPASLLVFHECFVNLGLLIGDSMPIILPPALRNADSYQVM